MKSDKDIFDLFRENEHKLNETPSPRAWDRLEERLETNTQRHQVSYYKQIAIAASIVAFVAVAFVGTMYLKPSNSNLAMNADSGVVLEDLVQNDSKVNTYKTMAFIRKHQNRLANPIEEGTNDRKLKPVKK